jgi:AraC-like DNA-binding protein
MRQNRSGTQSARRLGIEDSELHRRDDGLDLGARPETFVDRSDVRADRIHADVQSERDVAIAVPAREQLQDLPLAGRDEVDPVWVADLHGAHFTRAAARAPKDKLGYGVRHRDAAAKELANRIAQPERILGEEIAADARLDDVRDGSPHRWVREDEDRRGGGSNESREFSRMTRSGMVHGDDQDVRVDEGQRAANLLETVDRVQVERAIALQNATSDATVEVHEQHHGLSRLLRPHVTDSITEPRSETFGVPDGSLSLSRPSDPSQALVTCFELDTNRCPEALRIQRLSRAPGVEFWSVSSPERRQMLSDAFTACLVGAASATASHRWFSRGEHAVRTNAVALSNPYEVQRLLSAPASVSLFMIRWEPIVLRRLANELGLPAPIRFNLAMLEDEAASSSLVRLRDLLDGGADATSVEEAYLDATVTILRASAEEAPRRGTVTHPGVRRVLERIRASVESTESLDVLAKEARLSKYHFARCFQQTAGVAPHRYRKLLRLLVAKRHLESGLNVNETALAAGFSDASHLSRAFREWLGVTPWVWGSAWRASNPHASVRSQTIVPPGL